MDLHFTHNLYPFWIYLKVVEAGSLTAAARELDLSQPAVSGHLKQLEVRYGRLLNRGRTGVQLTERGREVLTAAQRVFDELDALHAPPLDGPLQGSVYLGASTFPAAYLLPAALARFQNLHPETEVALTVRPSALSQQAVLNTEVGLAVVGEIAGQALPPSIQGLPFAVDTLALFARPSTAEYLSSSARPQALNQVRLFWRERGSSTRYLTEGWLQPWLSHFACVREIGSSEAIRECVLAGLGVAIMSEQSVQRELGSGLLARVTLVGPERRRQFYLIRRRDQTASRLGAALWNFLSESP